MDGDASRGGAARRLARGTLARDIYPSRRGFVDGTLPEGCTESWKFVRGDKNKAFSAIALRRILENKDSGLSPFPCLE